MSLSTKRVPLDRTKAKLEKHDFALSLSRSLSSQQIETLISIFNRSGFNHLLIDDQKLSKNYILLLAYDDAIGLLKQADQLDIYKKCYISHLIENKFKIKRLLREKETKHLDPQIKELEETAKFTFARRKDFLFSPETVKSVDLATKEEGALDESESPERKEIEKEASNFLQRTSGTGEKKIIGGLLKGKSDVFTDDEPFDAYIGLFSSSELCRIMWSILKNIEISPSDNSFYEIFQVKDKAELTSVSNKLINLLKRMDLLDFVTPLHNKEIDVGLESINNLTDYFGQNVGIYFKFMEFYTKWLIPPAIFGVAMYLITSDKHPNMRLMLETIYCVLIMIWATLFVTYWQRRSSELCVRWHTYGSQFDYSDTRYDFKGKVRINLVTGLPEVYFPFRRKIVRYMLSILAHLPLMLFAFFLMVACLNARGYVVPSHWIYMPRLANWSTTEGLFDKTTHWKFVPTIFQVVSMVMLGKVNKALGFITTKWENHKTQTAYNNSIIIKRFLFEVVYTFLHLAYIAFWRLDVPALRIELVALFMSDEIRRLVSETFIPYLLKILTEKKVKVDDKKQDSTTDNEMNRYIEEKVEETKLAEYDEFDDYLEMIIQFGYITLFAAAFPLSGVLSLLFNGAEVLSDYFKLKKLYRRPMPSSVNGIGSWKSALDIMSYMCVVTNCVVVALNTQLKSLAYEQAREDVVKEEEDILFTVLGLEHLMLVMVYLLRRVIKGEPFWVRIYLRRHAHAHN